MKNTFLYFSSNYNLINKNRDENILKKFIKFLKISKFKNYKIYIKTHPSEFQNKYVRFFDNKTIFKDKSKNIIEVYLNIHHFWLRFNALVYAKYANKKFTI